MPPSPMNFSESFAQINLRPSPKQRLMWILLIYIALDRLG